MLVDYYRWYLRILHFDRRVSLDVDLGPVHVQLDGRPVFLMWVTIAILAIGLRPGDALLSPRMGYSIRKATLSDRPAIEQLITASARGLSRADYSDLQIEGAIKTVFGVDTNLILAFYFDHRLRDFRDEFLLLRRRETVFDHIDGNEWHGVSCKLIA